MGERTTKRKNQKKMKHLKYKRCSVCGDWAVCTLVSGVPTKSCSEGHIDPRPRLGGGIGKRIPR